MKMLSLFSGIGGIDLAATWAGIKTVAMCEIDPFCRKILDKHWPLVPVFKDVHDVNKELLESVGVKRVDIVAGGFPCQPYSIAGDRKGQDDDRALWPEMLRIITEIEPSWVVGENVTGFIDMGLDNALSDLESIGYTTETFIIPARGIGAYHQRERVFIIAHSGSIGLQGRQEPFGIEKMREGRAERLSELLPDKFCPIHTRPGIHRSSDGIPQRLERTKALGNSVMPQQIYPIFKTIKELNNV